MSTTPFKNKNSSFVQIQWPQHSKEILRLNAFLWNQVPSRSEEWISAMLGWTTWTSVLMKPLWICFWNSGKFDGYGFLLLTPSSHVFPQAYYHMPSSKALKLRSDCRQKCFLLFSWQWEQHMESDLFILICATSICGTKPDTDPIFCNATSVWTVISDFDTHHNFVVLGVTATILQIGSSLVEDSCEGSQRMDCKVLELTRIMVTALYKQTSWSSSSLSPAHKFTSFCGPSP